MAPPWAKPDAILIAVHRSVDLAEERLSAAYDKIKDAPLDQKDQKDELAERNIGFAISQFRVSLPIETNLEKDREVYARFPDHDAKDRGQDATARLTRIEFELKATPILNNPRPKK
jgi:hypothetical protein